MISKNTLFFGIIFSFALILYLAFPTRLPFNLELSLSQIEQNVPLFQSNANEIPVQKALCDPGLYVSQNLGKGQYLQVSDGFYYKVSPDDIRLAAYWIGPAPVKFCISDDDEYPIQITNTYSRTSVRVKQSSYDEISELMKQLEAEAPKQPIPPPSAQPMQPVQPTQPAPVEPQPQGPTGPTGPTGPIKKPMQPTRPVSPPARSRS